jgi:hypothetical protein
LDECVRYTMDWSKVWEAGAGALVNGLEFSADPLPLFSWPGRDEIGDDTVLHILSICIFLTIGPFSLAFDCAIDFPSMAENEWGVRGCP